MRKVPSHKSRSLQVIRTNQGNPPVSITVAITATKAIHKLPNAKTMPSKSATVPRTGVTEMFLYPIIVPFRQPYRLGRPTESHAFITVIALPRLIMQ